MVTLLKYSRSIFNIDKYTELKELVEKFIEEYHYADDEWDATYVTDCFITAAENIINKQGD